MATSAKLERDCVEADPKHYTVEAENDGVRVVRIRYGPREKSVMHRHARGVGIFLTDGNFEFTHPDGRVENITAKRGELLIMEEPWEHNVVNLADAPFEGVYVEVKD